MLAGVIAVLVAIAFVADDAYGPTDATVSFQAVAVDVASAAFVHVCVATLAGFATAAVLCFVANHALLLLSMHPFGSSTREFKLGA